MGQKDYFYNQMVIPPLMVTFRPSRFLCPDTCCQSPCYTLWLIFAPASVLRVSCFQTEPPEDESVINSKGDIIVALKYVPSEASNKHSKKKKGTLMILIKEAKNLPVPKGTTLPDPYCKW